MRRMYLPLLLVAVSLSLPAQVVALPWCSQIDESFCGDPGDCTVEVQFRGSCIGNDREWRCVFHANGNCPGETRPWEPCACPGGGGHGCDCLLAGSMITMADMTRKPVENIVVGDLVLSYDEQKDALLPSVVTKLHKPMRTSFYYRINGKLRATEDHPVLQNGEWTSVGALQIGDTLGESAGFGGVRVNSIERVDEPAMVYNFEVSLSTYVADGVIVHNKDDCELFVQYCSSCEGP